MVPGFVLFNLSKKKTIKSIHSTTKTHHKTYQIPNSSLPNWTQIQAHNQGTPQIHPSTTPPPATPTSTRIPSTQPLQRKEMATKSRQQRESREGETSTRQPDKRTLDPEIKSESKECPAEGENKVSDRAITLLIRWICQWWDDHRKGTSRPSGKANADGRRPWRPWTCKHC